MSYCVVSPDSGSHFIGDGLMLIAAVILAADIILAGKVRAILPLFHYSFYSTAVVTIWLIILTITIEGTDVYGIHSVIAHHNQRDAQTICHCSYFHAVLWRLSRNRYGDG